MEVIQVGVYPPPYGGISVHLSRLKEHLDMNGIENMIIDVSGISTAEKTEKKIRLMGWKKIIPFLTFRKRSIVHYHLYYHPRELACSFISGVRHRKLLTLHNERFLSVLDGIPRMLQGTFLKMLNSMDFVVVANDKCRKMAGQIVDDERKIHVIPAFIPPLDIPSLPPDGPIMQLKKKHRYLISSYAFNLSFHQGEDLYGIDMMIDLAARLTNDGLDFAFCLLLPNVNDIEYFNELTARIKALGIQDRFLVVTEPVRTASSLWRESSLVIRTTNTDGNSLSIPESLAVGVPVLASDCVPRPEGTLLFKSRDLEDLYLKTRDALSRLEEAKEQALLFRAEDNAIKLMELYKSLVNEDARGHRE